MTRGLYLLFAGIVYAIFLAVFVYLVGFTAALPQLPRTVDIGPIQVNQIWLPKIAAHWHTDVTSAFVALRDNACANFEAGAWILHSAMAETGDFWSGVALYHSHSPGPRQDYLRQVLRRALELQAIAAHDAPPAPAG